jgi:hypothetical protein
MFGFGSFADFAFADIGVTTAPTPIIVIDTHDGDHKKKRRFKAEVEARDRRKAELVDIYERLVEGRPEVVHKLVEEFIETPVYANEFVAPTINYDKLLDSLHTIEALYREHQEMDDEEVLLLL